MRNRLENLLRINRESDMRLTPDEEKIGEEIDGIINSFIINPDDKQSPAIKTYFNKHRVQRRTVAPKAHVPGKKPEIHYFYDFVSTFTKPTMRTGIQIKPEGLVYYEITIIEGIEQFNYPPGKNLQNKQRLIEHLRDMPHFPGDLRPPQAKD